MSTIRLAVALLGLVALSAGGLAEAKDAPLKPGKVHELTTKKHDRAWSLIVPSKYSARSSWPLVISSHGRGGSGKGEMRPWQGLANRHGFLVACPDMVTATNHRKAKSNLAPSSEDDEVLMEIFETVSAQFRVNRRAVMITGFSGGGNPSYHSGLRHPDVFTHICTRGGNFAPQQIPSSALIDKGKEHLHIYIFFGENDHVLITGDPDGTGQAYAARDALKQAGYVNLEFEKVPAMKHESRPAKAAAWLASYVEKNRKRFKEADKRDGLLQKARAALAKGKHKDAVKHLLKARAAEDKHELRHATDALRTELNGLGAERLLAAREQQKAGDLKAALKLASAVARDFHGLAAGGEAESLVKALKLAER